MTNADKYIFQRILARISVLAQVSADEILSGSRQRRVVRARQALMFSLRQHGISSPTIGRLAQRDHSTVLSAAAAFAAALEKKHKWATVLYEEYLAPGANSEQAILVHALSERELDLQREVAEATIRAHRAEEELRALKKTLAHLASLPDREAAP